MSKFPDQNKINQDHPENLGILVVDDHLLLADTLVAALKAEQNFEVEVARDVDTALQMVQRVGQYNLILLDYDVPGMDSLKGMHLLIKANGGGVALFSGVVNFGIVERAIAQGAVGFIPKTLPLKVLSHAIRLMAAGEVYLSSDWLQWASTNEGGEFGLKPREMKVLALLCEGLQNKEIGRELDMSEVIVKMDVKAICRKLDVRNRTQAVIAAHKHGLLETPKQARLRG